MSTRAASPTSLWLRRSIALLLFGAVCALSAEGGATVPPGRYTTTTDTVHDERTGLTWQRVVDSGTYTQAEAVAYCTNLTLAGKSDWRLPTRAELLSIVDRSTYNPSIDTVAFPDTPLDHFWASNVNAQASGYLWVIDFFGGYSNPYATTADKNRARCVR